MVLRIKILNQFNGQLNAIFMPPSPPRPSKAFTHLARIGLERSVVSWLKITPRKDTVTIYYGKESIK